MSLTCPYGGSPGANLDELLTRLLDVDSRSRLAIEVLTLLSSGGL
jgi:hypothetical protein